MVTGRVTLQDVARRAGVSRTTASFVLTGRRDMRISVDAEQRVLRAARELDYRPNLTARSLRTKHTQTIGLVSDTIATDAFAGEIIRGSTAAALTRQHLIFLGETEGDPATEKRLVQDMLDRGVDGFLYASMYTREIRIPAALRGHPVVLVNCLSRVRAPSVVPDERSAGRTAATALLEAGHRDRVYVVGESAPHVWAAHHRRAGIDEAFASAGTSIAGSIESPWWPEPAYDAVRAFLAASRSASGRAPSAFICLNDRLAFGAYQAAADAGLRVPDDLSVVAFDDSDLASWLRPRLTSLALPHFELGRRAVELLLDGHGPPSAGVHPVTMPLRRRDSIAPPAR
ncbi:LacI family DNA-binding transcriptional regulator [Dactylosporangium sp. CA-092794]|uniref:LacI family DNA-binding transcriptional regulator n=1 Tax=Dactylosporangium sp. CA-092794 TaxID=3239929 RepID=UPI003D8A8901